MSNLDGLLQSVIVHHASPVTLQKTVAAILEAGVSPEHVVVVDNSPPDQPDIALSWSAVDVVRVDNRGYGAAVNLGIDLLAERDSRPYTLVCSHETLVTAAALALIVGALEEDESAAVAGPTLFDAVSGAIWSMGGRLTPQLHLARHITNTAPRMQADAAAVERDWLDGAFTVYRTDPLAAFRFDESYFLYFEETDLHTRFRRSGLRVLWVPRASGFQTSSGIPPRLLGRNTMLFQSRHFSRSSGRRAVVFEVARAIGRKGLTGRGEWGTAKQIFAGWREAERHPTGDVVPGVAS